MKKRYLIILAAIVVAVSCFFLFGTKSTPKTTAKVKTGYQFTTLKKGNIEKSVSSTGTLSALNEVSVLAEMSGRVETVTVKNNDLVKKGQVLATLNTDLLKLNKASYQAAVQKAQATYDLQLLDYQNKTKLHDKGLLSDYDFQSSRSTLKVDEALLASAKVDLDTVDMKLTQYAIIKSPIDGIVLNVNIEKGQSVVEGSSSNSTTLFTLAEDLAKMQIKAEVDELDISAIKVGQEVNFTVEAQPDMSFTGTVSEIRLVPETTDNVVNYYVMIDTANRDGKLLPGMTADVNFVVQKKNDVLLVPSAALRFQPTGMTAAEIKKVTFLARFADQSEDVRKEAEAKYDEMIKQEAASAGAAKSGTSSSSSSKGLSSLVMGGGPGGPGGGPGAPGGSRRTSSSDRAKQRATEAQQGQAAPDAQGNAGQNGQPPAGEPKEMKALWYLDASGQPAVLLVEPGVSDGSSTEIVSAVGGTDGLEGKQVILKVKVN